MNLRVGRRARGAAERCGKSWHEPVEHERKAEYAPKAAHRAVEGCIGLLDHHDVPALGVNPLELEPRRSHVALRGSGASPSASRAHGWIAL